MNNKSSYRRSKLNKKRQDQFVLKQCITDMVIPNYNALRDPFLVGYFEQPGIKPHLRKTGVIVRKRGSSLKNYHELFKDPSLAKQTKEFYRRRKTASGNRKENAEQNESSFPNIEILDDRGGLKSAESGRAHKKCYKSKKMQIKKFKSLDITK